MKNNRCCKECEYVKCIAVNKQMYFCDHKDRTDDMGKLTENNLVHIVPKWCPKRNEDSKGSDNNDISGRYGSGHSKKDRIPKVQDKNIF